VTPGFKVLVAIQPETPGCRPLPETHKELLSIESIVQSENIIKLGIGGRATSMENILLSISDVSIAHFACHARQNMVNPLESALILEGGEKLKVSKFMEQNLTKASLVYLSACETAMGDGALPDEAMHIAASMLFIGFRGAVATMWYAHKNYI
jgi:CHAT domain-containing protein